jgi:hypothetical protein
MEDLTVDGQAKPPSDPPMRAESTIMVVAKEVEAAQGGTASASAVEVTAAMEPSHALMLDRLHGEESQQRHNFDTALYDLGRLHRVSI